MRNPYPVRLIEVTGVLKAFFGYSKNFFYTHFSEDKMLRDDMAITVEGLRIILKSIKDNPDGSKMTHSIVRSLARSIIRCELPFSGDMASEIHFLMHCISSKGLAHYDRANCAQRALDVVERWFFVQLCSESYPHSDF